MSRPKLESNLPHVADSCHARAANAVDTRTMVLNDGTSSTLDGKKTSNLKDDI